MHRLSERVLLTALRDGGLVTGDIDDMMAVHLAAVFMPHGLGHLMGLDIHDVGGFPQVCENNCSVTLPLVVFQACPGRRCTA